ncbi:MAG: FeoA domain-containing protein, partial [Eubacteriaceae bacterium]|nr:FeoA domain-containing protein [Eubacteriaceae bacterium]
MAKSKHEATLGDLAPGQSGFIVSVGNKRDAVKRRLVDMGLTPGTKITVVKAAPFGDPVEVRLRGYSLSLRKEDLLQIGIGKEMPGRAKDAAEKAASGALPHSGSEGRRAHFLKGEGDSAAHERWGQETPGEDPMQDGHWHERERHAKRYDSREHDRRTMRIALAGNPNSGKT